ncbi:MAG: oligosaccharide flippase family protein [Arcobacter sp.]|nr:oligosaccharide flippase family protein [Arcobacter sp.]
MFDIIKKAVKNSAIYGIGTLSTKLIGFILLPLYTTYISVSDYGVLAIAEVSSIFLVAIISLKINAAFFRWYWDKENLSKQKSIFFSSLLLITITSILFLIPIYFFSNNISVLLFEYEKYSYLIQLMAIFSVLQVIIELIIYLMRVQEKAVFFSTTAVIKLLVSLTVTVVLIVKYGRGIEGIYEAQIISQIIFFIITIKYLIANSEVKFESKIINGMLKYSIPLIFADVSGIILTASDRICLNFMDSSEQVGIYSLGFKVSNTIRVFLYSSAMMAVSPLIYQYIDKPGNKRFYSKLLTYFTFIVMAFVIILSLFARELIHLFAQNENYYDAWTVIPILSVAILFGIMKDVSLIGLNITKRTSVIALVVFVMALLNIGLNIYFIPLFSSKGAALATLITRIISSTIFYNIAQKYYKIPYELKKVFLILLVGIGIIFISSLTKGLNLFAAVGIKILLVASFPYVLYLLNFFEEVELQKIKGGWNKWKNPEAWLKNIKKIKIK